MHTSPITRFWRWLNTDFVTNVICRAEADEYKSVTGIELSDREARELFTSVAEKIIDHIVYSIPDDIDVYLDPYKIDVEISIDGHVTMTVREPHYFTVTEDSCGLVVINFINCYTKLKEMLSEKSFDRVIQEVGGGYYYPTNDEDSS